jgi:hypothetical protein
MKNLKHIFLNQMFGNGIKYNTHKIFFVLTQANGCTTWVLGDWLVFGDGPIYPIVFYSNNMCLGAGHFIHCLNHFLLKEIFFLSKFSPCQH